MPRKTSRAKKAARAAAISPRQTSFINLAGEISEERVGKVMAACLKELQEHDAKVLYFMISSGGGDVASGITLYNFLKSLPARIVMHSTGSIDSITNVVFLAGERRYAVKESTFLFHGVKQDQKDKPEVTLAAAEETVKKIKRDEEKIKKILVRETDISPKELEEMFRSGETKTAAYALKKGVIHQVKPCKVPDASRLVHIS